jgi:hypothetical protein
MLVQMLMTRKIFKIALLLMAGLLFGQTVQGQHLVDTTKFGMHPRLLMLKGEESRIVALIKNDPVWAKVHESVLEQCDSVLLTHPVERTLIGRRLLQVSRESLRRVFFLSYAWRTTNKKKYFSRCEEELLAVSKFTDWNPSHFLDVAEMTMAVSIGYDWLYNNLSEKSKSTIRTAILEKGLQPSLDEKYNGWLRATNNWNQVCNNGITFGAIATYETKPGQSVQLIERALNSIKNPMKEYAPDGGYKEGYSYWGYGTSFNVFFVDALQKLFGTDYGLSASPGFMKTASFYEQLIGPSGSPFSYSDAGGIEGLQPAMFWFADKLKDPSLLYVEKGYLETGKFNAKTNRLLPAALIWAGGVNIDQISPPASLFWSGKGENQVAMMRTDWKKYNGIYVGFKGGSPSVSHGHMDAGSFVLDIGGTRWSSDFGMQQYNSLESAGLDIWNMTQASQRWDVFRYSNLAHSTLTVNENKQLVQGNATIIKTSADPLKMSAVMDLSSIYQQDLSKAVRGIAIVDKKYVVIRDEIETGNKDCTIRWTMLTPAKVSSIESDGMILTVKGKKLRLQVAGLKDATFKTWRTDPPHSYDALNLGTVLVGFEVKVPAHSSSVFNVLLLPFNEDSVIQPKSTFPALKNW